MNLKEIREKKSDDLLVRLREVKEEIFRASCVSERLTPQKGAEIRKLRREVAQINTILRQRELTDAAKQTLAELDESIKKVESDKKELGGFTARKLRNHRAKAARVSREMELVKGK